MTIQNYFSTSFPGSNSRNKETAYPVARKQSSALYDMVGSFPGSPVKKIRIQLASSILAPDPRPLLEQACKMLQQLKNDRGNSLLHEAVLDDNRSLSKLCLKLGYENCQNDEGETPVHVAVRVQNSVLFGHLLKKEPNLLLENKQSQTACELAAELGNFSYVKQLLAHSKTLEQVVPKIRQHAFLSNLWQNNYKDLIALAAMRYEPESGPTDLTWGFARNRLSMLLSWINNPMAKASELKFSLSLNDWELLLFHFLGKKTVLFAKDRRHMHKGSHEEKMYVAVLWTWRTFCLRQSQEQKPLWIKIDQAIARCIRNPPVATLVQCIKKGQEPVIICSGWRSHSITLVFVKDLLFICNRGAHGALQKHNLTAFSIHRSAITPALLQKVSKLTEGKKEPCMQFLFEELPQALSGVETPFCTAVHLECQPSDQSSPNCVVANLRTAIRAILLANAEDEGDVWSFEKAMATYKEYALSSRYAMLQQFLQDDTRKIQNLSL